MHLFSISLISTSALFLALSGAASGSHVTAATIDQQPLQVGDDQGLNVSLPLFSELEELARLVDISYCVGVTGIHKPFECFSRCSDFPGFELVDVGPPAAAYLYLHRHSVEGA